MKIVRVLLLSVVGVTLPVALTLGAYTVSAPSFEAETPLVTVERIAEPQSPPPSPSPSPSPTPSATASPDDKSGRCSEPEHRGDPECLGASGEDNSGPGGGNSGSDSDNSGPGGGTSGSGSGNSGPGGGDD
jgi:uncharacterized membrane protein YgcG